MIISPLFISEEIFEVITLTSKISIHSVFNNSFNFKLGKAIVNVSHNKNILPPYGIVLDNRDFEILKKQINSESLQFNVSDKSIIVNHIELLFGNETKKYDSTMRKAKNKIYSSKIRKLTQKVLGYGKQNGFSIENDIMFDIIQNIDNNSYNYLYDKNASEFFLKLELLANFILYGENQETLEYFLGRGMGLTPSGDDFLVGILSVFSSYGVFQQSIWEIRDLILKNKGIYTNDISEQFLILSTEGKFSMSVISLLNTLSDEEFDDEIVDNVLNYGQSSGVDIILGIVFAYKVMNGRNQYE
ncbi:DUF2877 domain-containing protein [Brassicibacter mesophilus]|uniref:DUF2877 domain-containing protein n=1 Tax=Brassicibacter mesophilus TaxID=745119 RepID=UPI003D1A87DA